MKKTTAALMAGIFLSLANMSFKKIDPPAKITANSSADNCRYYVYAFYRYASGGGVKELNIASIIRYKSPCGFSISAPSKTFSDRDAAKDYRDDLIRNARDKGYKIKYFEWTTNCKCD